MTARLRGSRSIALLACWTMLFTPARAADWPVFGADPAHSGAAHVAGLNAGTVAGLRERWRVKLGDVADSAPIVVRNRLFETTRDGTTYALDVETGHLLWRFSTHGPKITTSVPAFDPAGSTLYVPGVDGLVHKLDPSTGHETRERGFPAQITMAPETEKVASPLTIAGGYLYVQTSGYLGDATPYVGHVVAIRLSDGAKRVFNTLCSAKHELVVPQSCPAQRSGMWSRAGVVVDPERAMGGRIYVATGNGPFNASAGDYGDSILALSSDGSRLLASYTPSDAADLEASDRDVGSSSPALLPRQGNSKTALMAVQGGKDSVLRLLDRTHLSSVVQTLDLGDELFSAPAVWTDRSATAWVFIGLSDGVHAYRVVTTNGTSRLVSAWHAAVESSREGASPVAGNGVVFVATSGHLVALDATNGHVVWNSSTIGAIHWESPVIANGSVYCSDEDGYVSAFAAPTRPRPSSHRGPS
jgi:outer membrane protein assembly factor BamB